jgi:hypothetical protein
VGFVSGLLVVLFLLLPVVSVTVFVASSVLQDRGERRRVLLLLPLFAAGLSLLAGALVVLLGRVG